MQVGNFFVLEEKFSLSFQEVSSDVVISVLFNVKETVFTTTALDFFSRLASDLCCETVEYLPSPISSL